MEIKHRQLAHGELKMAWASWNPYGAHPGGPRHLYTKFGEPRSYSYHVNKTLAQNLYSDVNTNVEYTAGTTSIPARNI